MPFNYKLLGYDDNFNHMLQSAETALTSLMDGIGFATLTTQRGLVGQWTP